MVQRWTFYDPTVPETHTFAFNPNNGGTAPLQKNVSLYATAASDGSAIFYEGRDVPQQMQFQGTVYSQAEYNAMVYWFNKRRQFQMTDDLGNTQWIYPIQWQPTRKYTRNFPWRADYTFTFYVFSSTPLLTSVSPMDGV